MIVELKLSEMVLSRWVTHTYSLFTPGAANGNNLFAVESKLLLEALNRKTRIDVVFS